MDIKQFEKVGIRFSESGYIPRVVAKDERNEASYKAIMDELPPALVTQIGNAGIPVELQTLFPQEAIEALLAPTKATSIFDERRIGDWTMTNYKIPFTEPTGTTQPYNDFQDGGESGVNTVWIPAENYLFQTTIKCGDREQAVQALARMNHMAKLQNAATTTIHYAQNWLYFYGRAGMENYGILNDPNLFPIEQSATLWSDPTSTADMIFKSLVDLFGIVVERAKGNVDVYSKVKFAMSPKMSQVLATVTSQYGKSVKAMMDEYFENYEIVVAPQYATGDPDDPAQEVWVYVDDVHGQKTGECIYSDKFVPFPMFRKNSYIEQKCRAGSWGARIYRPFLVQGMQVN